MKTHHPITFRSLDLRDAVALVVGIALALAGYGCDSDRPTAITLTTSAAIAAPERGELKLGALPAPSDRAPEMDREPAWSVETPRAQSVSADDPYTRPPLHEPNGAPYGDVGVPYPLPDFPADRVFMGTTRAPSSVETPAIPESSFGGSNGSAEDSFSESSFGASNGFTGSSFGADAGL